MSYNGSSTSRTAPTEDQVGTVKPYTFSEVRGMRYCELFLAKPDGILMYNTTALSDCPAAWWNSLDTAKIGEGTVVHAVSDDLRNIYNRIP